MRGRSLRVSLVENGTSIDTHRLARVTLAGFEGTSIIVAWHVPTTAHDIVNVLAQGGSLRTFFTSPETEFGSGHEVGPLVQLLQRAVTECAGEDQAANGVSVPSGTVRI